SLLSSAADADLRSRASATRLLIFSTSRTTPPDPQLFGCHARKPTPYCAISRREPQHSAEGDSRSQSGSRQGSEDRLANAFAWAETDYAIETKCRSSMSCDT